MPEFYFQREMWIVLLLRTTSQSTRLVNTTHYTVHARRLNTSCVSTRLGAQIMICRRSSTWFCRRVDHVLRRVRWPARPRHQLLVSPRSQLLSS